MRRKSCTLRIVSKVDSPDETASVRTARKAEILTPSAPVAHRSRHFLMIKVRSIRQKKTVTYSEICLDSSSTCYHVRQEFCALCKGQAYHLLFCQLRQNVEDVAEEGED